MVDVTVEAPVTVEAVGLAKGASVLLEMAKDTSWWVVGHEKQQKNSTPKWIITGRALATVREKTAPTIKRLPKKHPLKEATTLI